eukprot:UN00984
MSMTRPPKVFFVFSNKRRAQRTCTFSMTIAANLAPAAFLIEGFWSRPPMIRIFLNGYRIKSNTWENNS